jgi:hypothetical protein
MDVRQFVVLHVGNVDQDHDMLVEEAHKLQAFLCQNNEMAQGHGGSIILPNLHELHSKFLEDTSVFAGARKNVEMDSIEFLFLDAQCMSKVVGVGLHQALVTVTSANDVKVEALSESAWKCSLASMFKEVQDLGAFELIGFKMPEMEVDNIQTMNLAGEEVAKQFGVGLKDLQGDHIITMNKKEESNMLFPIIWKVAEVYKAFKEGDPHVTKRPTGVESSTGAAGASSSGSNQQGKEESKSVQSWSLLKPSTGREYGKGDEKDDEGKPPSGDPPPNSGPSGEPKMVPRTYTVKVYPEPGQSFHDSEIPSQIRTASMNPKLMIVFFRDQTGAKFLDVTTQTQCNVGCDVDSEHYFGWFQDDINISFQGLSEECKEADLKSFFASAQKGEEGEFTREITTITLGQARSIANLESRRIVAQGMIAGSGMRVEGHEDTTDSLGENSSRADVEEIRGVKQIDGFNVHKRNFREDLIYKFCIPTSIKTSRDPMRFLRYHDTFTPIIVGSWDVSKDNPFESAPYQFKVKRYLFEIEQGEVTFGRRCQQDYMLSMFINLAMTHLNGLHSDETIEIRQRHFVGPGIHVFPSW